VTLTTHSGDLDDWRTAFSAFFIYSCRRQFQDWFEQINARFSDLELCGVNANRYASRAGGAVVADQGALMAFVKASVSI
jgi:hypothetical protein